MTHMEANLKDFKLIKDDEGNVIAAEGHSRISIPMISAHIRKEGE